ncbi:hypothetical protein [Chitinibacter sp. S2-10]|uniref:hypothetical protein n=1 Tax=Chitinibacter sp. S2-10 TaxID=3373597 RepID=UPI003977DAFA
MNWNLNLVSPSRYSLISGKTASSQLTQADASESHGLWREDLQALLSKIPESFDLAASTADQDSEPQQGRAFDWYGGEQSTYNIVKLRNALASPAQSAASQLQAYDAQPATPVSTLQTQA